MNPALAEAGRSTRSVVGRRHRNGKIFDPAPHRQGGVRDLGVLPRKEGVQEVLWGVGTATEKSSTLRHTDKVGCENWEYSLEKREYKKCCGA
jgi:hypothetical protein